MVDVNPLSLIGKSNPDPRFALAGDKSVSDLQRGLAQLQLQGSNQLANTELSNTGAMDRVLAPLGLSQGGGLDAGLASLFSSLQAKRGGETAASLGRSGFGVDDPSKVFTPGEVPAQGFRGGFDLPGASAEKAKVTATGERGKDVTQEDIVGPEGKPVGTLAKRTVKETAKQTGKQSGTELAADVSTSIINSVQLAMPGAVIGQITPLPDGRYSVMVDGVSRTVSPQ